ncbi:F-box domain-containing protein [Favolaschia claudopus]|uniref:F-box domain-containing protein n=1 Tax=Favolaschia claudopus TaxID=2862362 RepID=A0AAW0BZY8_9AGAR
MPAIVKTYPLKSPAFLRLPQELLDEIISDLEHCDLVSLALVSRASSGLVIPRHTEYRVLRTRHLLPAMWAHLARRADLTRNIREVHLCERLNKSTSDRVPKSLISRSKDEQITHVVEERRIRNICTALGHMRRLHTFTWSWEVDPPSLPTIDTGHEDAILDVLSRKKSLRHIALAGMFGTHAPGIGLDQDSTLYPLWRFSNLTSISLRGDSWIRPTNIPHLKRMLSRSAASLEFLEMPMEFTGLADLKFPYLRSLNLFLQSGGMRSIDPCVVRFLSDHPGIEDLSWLPLGPVYVSPKALPALKRLRTNIQVVGMLESRTIESLDIYQLDPATLVELKNLPFENVRKIKLHAFGDLPSMYELAELFPNLVWLSMPSRYGHFSLVCSPRLSCLVNAAHYLLPRFPKLEVFRGQGLWASVTLNMQRMHGVIMQLVQLCPNLRELDHSGHNQARQDWNRITIIREGPEGENVRYRIDRPPARRWFDALEGVFD